MKYFRTAFILFLIAFVVVKGFTIVSLSGTEGVKLWGMSKLITELLSAAFMATVLFFLWKRSPSARYIFLYTQLYKFIITIWFYFTASPDPLKLISYGMSRMVIVVLVLPLIVVLLMPSVKEAFNKKYSAAHPDIAPIENERMYLILAIIFMASLYYFITRTLHSFTFPYISGEVFYFAGIMISIIAMRYKLEWGRLLCISSFILLIISKVKLLLDGETGSLIICTAGVLCVWGLSLPKVRAYFYNQSINKGAELEQ